jgi:hypothetical protein
VGVPLRQLLVAVHNIDRVVDVQDNRPGWLLATPAPDIDQGVGQADDLAWRRRILPARNGRLRAEVTAAVRQPSAGQLQGPKTITSVLRGMPAAGHPSNLAFKQSRKSL